MMKKRMLFLLTGMVVMNTMNVMASHEHTESEIWKADRENHWHVCEECEEVLNLEAHEMDEFEYCEICETTICEYEDNTYSIISYDEQGSMSSQIDYDKAGNVLAELIYEYEYYEDGNPKHTWEYMDGVLSYESIYLVSENDEFSDVYMSEDIIYDEDTKTVSKYDEDWNLLSVVEYDADGTVIFEDIYEYEFDEEGNMLSQITYTDGVKSYEAIFEMGEDEWTYVAHEIYYDEEGQIFDEYYYDEEGNEIEK